MTYSRTIGRAAIGKPSSPLASSRLIEAEPRSKLRRVDLSRRGDIIPCGGLVFLLRAPSCFAPDRKDSALHLGNTPFEKLRNRRFRHCLSTS
jgi:hypothetical protein